MEQAQAKTEVIAAGKTLVASGLVSRTWGNVSCRIDGDRFAITPSGVGYERLTPEQIVVVDMQTLQYAGEWKPSSEKGIHAAAYRLNPTTNFVIHTHQTYATVLSVAGYSALALLPEERDVLGGDVGVAEYGLPGTKALRQRVESVLANGCSALLMKKHGALLAGTDRSDAFGKAIALEQACRRATEGLPEMGGGAPVLMSERTAGGATVTWQEGQAAPQGQQEAQRLHAAVYQAYPEFSVALQAQSPVLELAAAKTRVIPALLDDFAQMVGGDVRVCGKQAQDIVKGLRGHNAVYIDGLGLLCCAGELSDCQALLAIAEKNALTYLHALRHEKIEALSLLDRKLMRLIYTRKYSKKK